MRVDELLRLGNKVGFSVASRFFVHLPQQLGDKKLKQPSRPQLPHRIGVVRLPNCVQLFHLIEQGDRLLGNKGIRSQKPVAPLQKLHDFLAAWQRNNRFIKKNVVFRVVFAGRDFERQSLAAVNDVKAAHRIRQLIQQHLGATANEIQKHTRRERIKPLFFPWPHNLVAYVHDFDGSVIPQKKKLFLHHRGYSLLSE
ncbi:hypothetical protein [Brevibacillus agri]|uniref:hypothetical protein n=1 Tax=Brevibacillus agri TaxID=51101 RepID=UPI0013EB8115|nr:hypothetical protein [Brevibacillus agri]